MCAVTIGKDKLLGDAPEARIDLAPWTIGPLGQNLTRNGLPSVATRRWTPLQKAEVVAGVRGELLSLDDALGEYGLSLEEFAGWELVMARFGMRGLRATQAQTYRAIMTRDQCALPEPSVS